MVNKDVWQGCVLSRTNTAGALTANAGGRQSYRDHLRGRRGSELKRVRANPLYSDVIAI